MLPQEKEKALEAIKHLITIILDTLKDAGDDGFPSGHLYAALMGVIRLDQYQTLIEQLKRRKIIRESNHVLYLEKPNNG